MATDAMLGFFAWRSDDADALAKREAVVLAKVDEQRSRSEDMWIQGLITDR